MLEHTLSLLVTVPLTLGLVPVQDPEGTHVPPQAGEVAKPLETVYWYWEGPTGKAPAIADLRGKVALVHTWGYYCDPCMREGVPYVVDLMRANKERGLTAVSLSVQVGDDKPAEHFVKVGRELGIDHPLGLADAYGSMSPYMNMNVSKGLTWCFVIGRDGGVLWQGDPSIDDDEFLEAVQVALAREATPALKEGPPEPLEKAIAEYVAGDLEKAAKLTAKTLKKYAKKKDGAEVVAYGQAMLDAIDGHRATLAKRAEDALTYAEVEKWLRASRALALHFPKSAEVKELREQRKILEAEEEIEVALEQWERWLDLEAERPALFPARLDKANKKYAKALRAFVEKTPGEHPGHATAVDWLKAFEAAIER